MIIQCNSCDKKFNVPDGAITEAGRLVQCSSCGNKWTQYPLKKTPEVTKIAPIIPKTKPKKKSGFVQWRKELQNPDFEVNKPV